MSHIKRLISLALAFVMVLSMLPLQAFAEEDAAESEMVPEMTVSETSQPAETVENSELTETTEVTETSTDPETELTETEAAANPVETEGDSLFAAQEAALATQGSCGENVTWSFDQGSGTLTISGMGRMNNYVTDVKEEPYFSVTLYQRPWYEYEPYITRVVVERGISMIGSGAFYNCVNLRTVTVPDTMGAIGMYAFYGCESLTGITLPEGITAIGEAAFWGCTALAVINIPSSVNFLYRSTFQGCISLTQITLPDLLFAIEENALAASGLQQITIPGSVSAIGNRAFANCENLETVSVQGGVKEIGQEAFSGCIAMTSVTLPGSLTTIGDRAFEDTDLEYVRIPTGVTELGEDAFPYDRLTNIVVDPDNTAYRSIDGALLTKDKHRLIAYPGEKFYRSTNIDAVDSRVYFVPEGVQVIGEDAFSGAYFTGIVFPEGLTTLEDNALGSGLNFVVLPKTLQSIGNYVFENGWEGTSVDFLQDVYFGGSEEQWQAVTKGEGNNPLADAVLHYNGERNSGHCRYGIPWSFDKDTLTIHGSEEFDWYSTGYIANFASAKDAPWYLFRDSIRKITMRSGVVYIGDNVFSNLPNLDTVELGDTVQTITHYAFANSPNLEHLMMPGSVRSIWEYAFDNCPKLNTVVYQGTMDDFSRLRVYREGNDALYRSDFVFTDISDYVDNSSIEINYAGGAYAYYITAPNIEVCYKLNDGPAQIVRTNNNGVLRISLGEFEEEGTWPQTIDFIRVGAETFTRPQTRIATVTVTPLTFSQTWKASFDAKVAAGLSAGTSVKVGNEEVEATLGKASVSAGRGSALTFTRKYTGDTVDLLLTSDVGAEGGVSLKSGITGKAINTGFSLGDIHAGVDAGVTGTYGVALENYTGSLRDKKVIGTFLLGEALTGNPNMVFLKPFCAYLTGYVYRDSGCTSITGSGVGASASAGANLGTLKVNDKALFSVAGAGIKASFSASEQTMKTDTETWKEKEVGYKTEANLSVLIAHEPGIDLGADILGRDTAVKVSNEGGEKTLETTFLSAAVTGQNDAIVGKDYTVEYHQYLFRDESLDRLVNQTRNYRAFVYGDRGLLTADDIGELAKVVSNSNIPIEYSRQTKDQILYTVPLELGGSLGASLDFGVELSYLEALSYTTAQGYAENNQINMTGESIDLQGIVKDEALSLGEWISQTVASLRDDLLDFVDRIVNDVKEGVDNLFAFVKEKKNAAKNWLVSLVTPKKSKTGNSSFSYYVDVESRAAYADIASGIQEHGSNFALTRASTVGMPVLVAVTDADTGEEVTDLSEEPLEFGIRYTEEDLKAAGLSSYSAALLNGDLALYRYCDEGDYFEFIGGDHNREEKTVTAQIVKTGQYILAVDSCAPVLRELDLSDFRSNPVITARVDDMTGLDAGKFVFKLDGVIKVDNKNIGDHYDSKTGVFTYAVQEPLAEGEHTMTFQLTDTSGNADTYEYSFRVDLTAPVVETLLVTGYPNAGSGIQIRAKILDENLTGVYAVFSKLQPDGTWSSEATAEMGQLEDNGWGLDYEGDGTRVRVFLRAVDFAGNLTVSETKEMVPFVESVAIGQEYIALYEGQMIRLTAEAAPAEFTSEIRWSVEKGSERILSVDDRGNVTALRQGTGYVLASVQDGARDVTARCRVDVAESLTLDGVELSQKKVTTELYSTAYTELDILLMLRQNYADYAQNYNSVSQDADQKEANVAISDVCFADWDMDQRFNLVLQDDRSVQIVPTQAAVDNPDLVEKVYVGPIIVTVQGKEYYTEDLTLTVKKTLPKLKVSIATFNSFFFGQRQPITVTGATVTGIQAEDLPDWLQLNGTELVLTENVTSKDKSAKVTLQVETEQWRVPAKVSLSVKNAHKAPGLKLSASSVQLSTAFDSSEGAMLSLQPKNRKDSLAALGVVGISADEGYTVSDYNAATGTFILKAEDTAISGKTSLTVSFRDTANTLTLPLTVKLVQPTLKLSAKSVTLNPTIGDSASVQVTAAPADYVFSAPDLWLLDSENNEMLDTGVLEVRYEGNEIRVSTTEDTPFGETYKLYIRAGGSKDAILTVKTVEKMPVLKLKQSSQLDLSFPETAAVIQPVFTNYGGKTLDFTYSIVDSKTGTDVTSKFELVRSGDAFCLTCSEPAEVSEKQSFLLQLKLILPNGEPLESSLKLKVKRTAVNLKLSAKTLTLNKAIFDKAWVSVSCSTKGYTFIQPDWTLLDAKGGELTGEQLTIDWSDGKLFIATNEATQYDTSYKLQIRAEKGAKVVTLAIKILADTQSAVTGTMKATGTLDVIRDGTALEVESTWKNCNEAGRTEVLRIFCGTEDVTRLFSITGTNGSYLLSRAENAKLDHSKKYTASLTVTFANGTTATATCPLKLKMGSAKLTPRTEKTVLFADDCNSRISLSFVAVDTSVNKVARVELTGKTKDQFELFDYGNGQYAIGFKDSRVPVKLSSASLPLSVWLDGNETTKANTTVNVKLTIVK